MNLHSVSTSGKACLLLVFAAWIASSKVLSAPPVDGHNQPKRSAAQQRAALWKASAVKFPDDTSEIQLVRGMFPLHDDDERIDLRDVYPIEGDATFLPANPQPADPEADAAKIEIDAQVAVYLLQSNATCLLWRTLRTVDAEKLVAGRLVASAAWGRRIRKVPQPDNPDDVPDEFCEVTFVHELPSQGEQLLSKCVSIKLPGGRSAYRVQNVDAFNGYLGPCDVFVYLDGKRTISCALSLTSLEQIVSTEANTAARGAVTRLRNQWTQCDWAADCIFIRRDLRAAGDGIERGLFFGVDRARTNLPSLDLVECRSETIAMVRHHRQALGHCEESVVEGGIPRFTIGRMGTVTALLLFGLVRDGESELGKLP